MPDATGLLFGSKTLHRMLAAFTYRDFRVQWFGACTSSIGTWMQIVAQNWLVLSLTDSAFFLGLDAFLQQLPIMLFTLIGGVLADRHDRRRTLLASQYVQMATSAALALLMYFERRRDLAHPRRSRSSPAWRRPSAARPTSRSSRRSSTRRICRTPSRSTRFSSTSRACSARCCSAPRSLFFRAGATSEPQAMNAVLRAQRAVVPRRHLHADVAAREAHPAGRRPAACATSCRAASRYVRHHGEPGRAHRARRGDDVPRLCRADVPAAVHAARVPRRAPTPTAT